MQNPPARRATRSRFFLHLSLFFLAVALVGFSTTYFVPLVRSRFEAPPIIHVHGALLFGWLLLLIAQSSLIVGRRVLTHRRLGWIGAALAVGIVVSGILVGLHATQRDLARGPDDFVSGQFVNTLIEMVVFGALVAAALLLRRSGESHKRLLILATISALAPAWLRFRHLLPAVDNPFVVFSIVADSVLLIVILRDWIVLRRLHPVYLYAGGAMVAVHAVELLAMTSAPWMALSRWLLA